MPNSITFYAKNSLYLKPCPNFSQKKMSDIPTELFRIILLEVPVKSLLRFRSVCKTWLSIIDEPDFAKMHLQLHLHRESNGGQIIIRYDSGKLYSFSLSSLDFSETYTKTIVAAHIKNLVRRGLPRITDLPVPSCHGLILISHNEKNKIWAMWNPFTCESLELPDRHSFMSGRPMERSCVGLGYDFITDDYKVVSIGGYYCARDRTWLETLVYSVKLGKWRKIKDFHNCQVPYWKHGVFLNGALHWITSLIQPGYLILAFDLGTENYSLIPLPSALSEATLDFSEKFLCLDVLGGSLFVSSHNLEERFEVWMMEDYGGKNTWTKLFSTNSEMVEPKAVAYLKIKEKLLIQYNKETFMWFDIKKRSSEKVWFDVKKRSSERVFNKGYTESYTSQVFQPSLFRLKNNGGVDGVETTNRKRKRTGTDRLELTLSIVGQL